MKRGFE